MINKSDNQAFHPTTEEIPTLKISNTIFTFNDLRVGSTIADTFTISNAGGGVLNSSIKTNKKWLKVFQSDIDTTQKKQDIPFQVNTSGLAFGFKDTGTIEIKSNAGIEKVNVTISVEAETIALLRKEINIPVIAGIGVLGVAITVAVIGLLMMLKNEKEARLAKSTIKLAIIQETGNNRFAIVSPDRWKGEYFSNEKLQGSPLLVRDDGNGFINFDWGNKGPSDSYDIGKDNFSVRWTRAVFFDDGIYRFIVTCDKNCRLSFYVDNELKYSRGSSQSSSLYTQNVPLAAGKHIIKLEYYKFVGDSSIKLSWQTYQTNTSTLEQSTTNQKESNSCIAAVAPDRWKGEYYNNSHLSDSPSMVRDDGRDFLNFAWGNSSPGEYCGISKDNFSVRWTRTVNFVKGTYRFTVTIRNVRLYIDGIMKLEESYIKPRTYTVDVPLTEGKHTVKMEYCERHVDGITKLVWQALPTSEQPAAQLPITYNLNGEWEGKVDNRPVKLSIAQDGNSLSGNIVYDTEFSKTNVKEHLSGEINNDKIVLKGTGYTTKGVTSFSLDTFSGTISSQDRDFIRGNYTDEAGHSGEWFVKRKSRMFTQESMPNQSKKQDNYKPDMTNRAPQAKLTKKMKNIPAFQIKHERKRYRDKAYYTAYDAKVKFLDNDSLEILIKGDRVIINCTWSSNDHAYVGTWRRDILELGPVSKLLLKNPQDNRPKQGEIKLFPRFDSNNEIKCFYGYIMSYNAYIALIGTWSYGNNYPGTPIKIVPTFGCNCPDPEGD